MKTRSMSFLLAAVMMAILFSAAAKSEPAITPSAGFPSGTEEKLVAFTNSSQEAATPATDIPMPFRLAVLAADILATCCIARLVVRRRLSRTKDSAEVPEWLVWFFLIFGLLASIPPLIIRKKSDWTTAVGFEAFSLIGFSLAAFAALERLSWDESGFAYTSIIGKTARYGFEEIRWIETTHPYGRRYEPLAYKIHLTGRSIRFEDLSGKLKGFLLTYSAWLRKRNLEPWQKTAKREWLAMYRSHSPFRKKLDRIECSMTFTLVISTLLGLAATGGSLYLLCAQFLLEQKIGTPAEVILISVIFLCLGLFLLGIWPAIALMDSQPGLLRMYVHKSIRILPDPEKQEKQEP